ncbi:MAG TPA: hypothetical protein VHK24_11010, partial [Steroidobacter sp.]|nr:hypothetical protein [Steroidobacter sp.]
MARGPEVLIRTLLTALELSPATPGGVARTPGVCERCAFELHGRGQLGAARTSSNAARGVRPAGAVMGGCVLSSSRSEK